MFNLNEFQINPLLRVYPLDFYTFSTLLKCGFTFLDVVV